MTWVDVSIVRVIQETPQDRSFVLALPEDAGPGFTFVPGQHLAVRDPGSADEREWVFSLSAGPSGDGTLQITVRGRGAAVQPIYAAADGATWQVRPPAGDFRIEAAPGEHVVLLGAGSGVTPFRAFTDRHDAARGEARVRVIHSARASTELLFARDFSGWADAAPGTSYVPTVTGDDAAWQGRRGRIDAGLLARAISDPENTRVFACGPGTFVEEMLRLAAEQGVAADRLMRERW